MPERSRRPHGAPAVPVAAFVRGTCGLFGSPVPFSTLGDINWHLNGAATGSGCASRRAKPDQSASGRVAEDRRYATRPSARPGRDRNAAVFAITVTAVDHGRVRSLTAQPTTAAGRRGDPRPDQRTDSLTVSPTIRGAVDRHGGLDDRELVRPSTTAVAHAADSSNSDDNSKTVLVLVVDRAADVAVAADHDVRRRPPLRREPRPARVDELRGLDIATPTSTRDVLARRGELAVGPKMRSECPTCTDSVDHVAADLDEPRGPARSIVDMRINATSYSRRCTLLRRAPSTRRTAAQHADSAARRPTSRPRARDRTHRTRPISTTRSTRSAPAWHPIPSGRSSVG